MTEDRQQGTQQGGAGFKLAVAAIICAVLGIIFYPFAIAGIVLAIISYKKGGGTLAAVAIPVAVFTLLVGFIVLNLMQF